MPVNSHNEWDQLKEVIVGTAEGSAAVLSWDHPDPPSIDLIRNARALSKEAFPQWFLDEIAEDLDGLCQAIKDFGTVVHRPEVHDIGKTYSSPFWTSTGNNI